ncbi:MAG: DUF354 domain-containing protein [Candidatus Lokiarchaeota archaeon]|nr:DUF354 domain-containing protein [Candidatus Lokiarchaeota archaeon]
MAVAGKRIWVDIEHQKGGIMLHGLFKRLEREGAKLLYTARDFGNNRQVLDELGIPYKLVGKHGGATLYGKLEAHVERLRALLPVVHEFNPDHSVSFGSVEHIRIAFGLGIKSIFFNDEPRSAAVARLTHALAGHIITPRCIPADEYFKLGASKEQLVRYNGIDEIAWIARYRPDPGVLDLMGVEKGQYVLMRTEMTHTEYLRQVMRPEETRIAEFLPPIVKAFPNHKFFLLVRLPEQEAFLKKETERLGSKNVVVTRYIPRIQDFMFYSALVASGGGTIVRESSLMGIPSIEFFPGETAWQEHFLMDNGFPLHHVKDPAAVVDRAMEALSGPPDAGRFTEAFKEKLKGYEDPTDVCYEYIARELEDAKS